MSAAFTGGKLTSDTGIPLLRQVVRQIGLSRRLTQVLPDPPDPARTEQDQFSLVRQRLYGLCAGYEGLNDHDTLRDALAWQRRWTVMSRWPVRQRSAAGRTAQTGAALGRRIRCFWRCSSAPSRRH